MILNLMQRMSGIATITDEYVKAIAKTKAPDEEQDADPRHTQDHSRSARSG